MNEWLFDEMQEFRVVFIFWWTEFRVVLDLGLELLLMRVAKVCKWHILLAYIWIRKRRIQLAYIWILDERELTNARYAQSTSSCHWPGILRRNPSSLARWVFYVMHRSWRLELGTTELHIHIHNDSNEAICLDKQWILSPSSGTI